MAGCWLVVVVRLSIPTTTAINNRREGRDFFLLSLFKYIFYNNTHTHIHDCCCLLIDDDDDDVYRCNQKI